MALRFRGQFGLHLLGQFIIGIRFKPSAHGEPFGRLVSVPTVLISQNHFNNVVTQAAERRDQFWQHKEVRDCVCQTPLGNIFRWWQLPPVRLADKDDSASAQAPCQKLNRSSDSPADPGSTHAGRHIDLFVRDIACRIVMDELDLIGHAQFFGTKSSLLTEQLAHVDTDANDTVITCPCTQHLSRTAAEIKHSCSRLQT